MKKLLFNGISILFFTVFLLSCNKNEDPITGTAKEGGLIETSTKLLNYFYGTSVPLVAKIKIYQGTVKTTKIEVYKQYFTKDTALTHDPSGETEISTNQVLLTSFDVSDVTTNSFQEFSFNYDDLIAGLTLAGNPMPETDESLAIGSKWILSFKVINDNGTVSSTEIVTVGISTRFAGTYKIIHSEYYRIGVPRPDVAYPDEYVIESIDQVTYKIQEYAGPFAGNEVLFTVDGDGNIDYPTGQLFNGQPNTTCALNPADLSNVPCGLSNKAVADFVTGKDRLSMAFGYFTAGSGPREFYVELEKIP